MTNMGMVSPEERKVHVSNTVSTLFQFRAIDFGMESCEVMIRFTTPEFKINSFPLSLYRDIQVTSSGQSVQWNTTFACHWDELLLFELTCAGNDEESPAKSQDAQCEVEWWQGKRDKHPINGASTFFALVACFKVS
ncbi:hypothetical protein K435DRAFT_679764 [Dendrothele bispora CBS 962.96]|uniref:Ubiquitin 3 binding protein But2 C-terminal domain-containing protein n=1 Tax=Dendrothele bispora (strain CBS 962.96) TaxID=1314807 RepID=A0A4S8LHA0_DENBC|nr:hypothetical protein K435DRAFT_679764 [Dendrothele bispora CBS 962.96]